jgi:hypothetical protein
MPPIGVQVILKPFKSKFQNLLKNPNGISFFWVFFAGIWQNYKKRIDFILIELNYKKLHYMYLSIDK